LQEETGARVWVDTQKMEAVLKGSEEAIANAKRAVLMLIENRNPPCKYFAQGMCSRGQDCVFAHNGKHVVEPCEEKSGRQPSPAASDHECDEVGDRVPDEHKMCMDDRAKVVKLLNGMPLSYTSFKEAIHTCDKSGEYLKALELLKLMVIAEIKPDVVVYSLVINACARGGQSERALELLAEMRTKDVTPNVLTYNAALHACNKCGKWGQTVELLAEMKKEGLQPNASSYREAVDACGKLAKWQKAVDLVQAMRSEGVLPNVITYNTAIHACTKTKQSKMAVDFFQELLQTFDTPDMMRRREKVNALANAGDLRSAVAIYYEMHHAGLLRKTVR
jgi:pentatricopeptide repeat protein